MRRADPHQERARELCRQAGIDPDSRVPMEDKPGRSMPAWCAFKKAAELEEIKDIAHALAPLRKAGDLEHRINIRAETALDADNITKVQGVMKELMRVPTIVDGAVMPDACPVGKGEIPVGGVVATKEAIHPGFHSADICCSMAVSIFNEHETSGAKHILDAGMKLSHFGKGGRDYSHDMQCPTDLLAQFEENRLLRNMTTMAQKHFGTQGDGNHFFYVGRVKSTGQIALVTHHGSRAPGATLYKFGMDNAQRWRRKLSPETPPHAAWIPSETEEGEDYWNALQIIRTWTKKNHFTIHDAIAKRLGLKVKDRFWNEHNFVFRKSDGLFYHAKGATPAFPYWAADASGLTLIPLNMAQPILISRGLDAPNALGFAPHGAGRNLSRTGFLNQNTHLNKNQMIAEQTKGLDIRFFCGIPDLSELPGAYKDASTVRAQINEFALAEIVDEIEPIGCIMCGDSDRDAPWRKKKLAKKLAKRELYNNDDERSDG